MRGIGIAAVVMVVVVVGLGRLASAELVDLCKPFEADKDPDVISFDGDGGTEKKVTG